MSAASWIPPGPEDGELSVRFVQCPCGMEFVAWTTMSDPSNPVRVDCPRCLRMRTYYENGLTAEF